MCYCSGSCEDIGIRKTSISNSSKIVKKLKKLNKYILHKLNKTKKKRHFVLMIFILT